MNVRLKYSTAFTAGVFYDGQLRMNNYRLVVHFTTVSNDTWEQNVALDRIKYFVHNQLESAVFVNSEHQEHCQRLVAAGIKVVTLPEEPVDQVVGIMLHCKLNAIVEDRMIISQTEIASDLGENIYYLHDDDEQLGPLAAAGWWNDSEPTHCDSQLTVGDKIVAITFSHSWRDLDLHWEEETLEAPDTDNKLVFADFQRDETK